MRFFIYSASLRRWFEAYSLRRRAVLGYFTGDFTFAMFMQRVTREGEFAHRDAWFLGACGFNWLVWQVASIVGIVAATAVPTEWGLQFAGTLALLALAIPACLQWPALAGAAVAAPVAVFARGLPFGLGLLIGIIAGIAAAVLVDAFVAQRKAIQQEQPP
jgi:predicted branched-subunit amino acid permease